MLCPNKCSNCDEMDKFLERQKLLFFPSTNNKPQKFTKACQIFITEIYHSTKTVFQKTGKISNIFSLFKKVSIILILMTDNETLNGLESPKGSL